jgi:NADH-quinone oxidoreductase subunit H
MAVVPYGVGHESAPNWFDGLVPIDPPAGLVYLLAVSSISALGLFLAGWSSRNKYALLGAMRAVAQLISYEIPQVLSTMPVILWTGSLSLVAIMNQQMQYGWFLFSPPGLLAFALLTVASIAEVNRAPFDIPEAESEIIAGFHTEYSSMRFGLFFLAEYLSVFAVSCLGTVLFLGGGTLPPPFTDFPHGMIGSETVVAYWLTNAITVSVFAAKVFAYIFFMFWVRATVPRMRVDRLMNFAWKYMIPLSLINILVAAIWYEFIFRPSAHRTTTILWGWVVVDWNAVYGWLVTLPIVVVSIWAITRIYRQTKPSPVMRPSFHDLNRRGVTV